uniref:MFS domain-containing protein n=1 Tax=Heligmosomoides polygyrus TaxID=6339 RepID=A0A8L8KET7_HELPZ
LLMVGYFSMAVMTSNIGETLCNYCTPGRRKSAEGSYEWSVEMQGYIVGAAFLGGMLSVFPSGMAIDRFSMRHLLLLSVLLLSTVNVLVPVFAETMGPIAVIVLRFLMGVGEGMMIPGINGMITGWIPTQEKSAAASLYTSGNQLAGLLGFLWCVVWQLTVNNSPANTKWISDHEVSYLQQHLPKKQIKSEKKVIPWCAMARSAPLLVVLYSGIVVNMMIAMILVYIPVYFKDVLKLEVKQVEAFLPFEKNGFYTALPHTFNLASKLIWGFLMDHLKKKKLLTPTQTVKLSQVIIPHIFFTKKDLSTEKEV